MSDVLSWIRLPGPFLIGHRGHAVAAPENTPPAFEAALEAGCDGVELDVRATRDGVLVVHHDEKAAGPRGTVPIETTPWSELEGLELRGKGGAYRLPLLAHVLEGLSRRCLINVEVKPPGPERRDLLAVRLLAEIDPVRPRESVLVSSFDAGMLAALHRRNKELHLGFLFSTLAEYNALEQEEAVEGLTALHPRRDIADRRLMKRAQERGLSVHVWTVNDPTEAERLLAEGARALITDRPELLEEIIR
jgi:glycerophosphoryl diester phosphodiesterase